MRTRRETGTKTQTQTRKTIMGHDAKKIAALKQRVENIIKDPSLSGKDRIALTAKQLARAFAPKRGTLIIKTPTKGYLILQRGRGRSYSHQWVTGIHAMTSVIENHKGKARG